jgi:hypothetical protein
MHQREPVAGASRVPIDAVKRLPSSCAPFHGFPARRCRYGVRSASAMRRDSPESERYGCVRCGTRRSAPDSVSHFAAKGTRTFGSRPKRSETFLREPTVGLVPVAPVRNASLRSGLFQPLRGEGHANLRFSSEEKRNVFKRANCRIGAGGTCAERVAPLRTFSATSRRRAREPSVLVRREAKRF